MITVRPHSERGHAYHGWLDTWHSFSFADYYDPQYMGFSVLRVINDDRIAPAAGFPTHGHRDMEIVTYVLKGQLQHRDSMGNGTLIRAGEVQRMSAGVGVQHSEFNAASNEELHLLQIWLLPAQRNLPPSYEQRYFSTEDKLNRWCLLVAPAGSVEAAQVLSVHQDVRLYASVLQAGQALQYAIANSRRAYLQVARGRLQVNGQTVETGDGVKIEREPRLQLSALEESEVLLFDLP